MAETVQIDIAVDAGQAVGAFNELKSAVAGVGAPIAAMRDASAEAAQAQQAMVQGALRTALETARALRQLDAAYVEAFKNGMQIMVDSKQLSLRQALGFDIDYSAKVFEEEQ